jgi:hypothetical protein
MVFSQIRWGCEEGGKSGEGLGRGTEFAILSLMNGLK